ncbi:MAG: flagellar biosynthesis anti-sigma factor FlgM [Rubrivivax sp.]|jgi:negative regulator of flagellin synthesis FlgM
MKIGPLESKPSPAPVAGDRKTTATKTGGAGNAEASAKVELSSAALMQPGAADGTFDTEKVERIAQAIRDGKFEVNAEAIADKLIANAQELLGKASR